MKLNIRFNTNNKKHLQVFLELSILIIGIFSFSYIIHETQNLVPTNLFNKNKLDQKVVQIPFEDVINFFDLIPSISAQQENSNTQTQTSSWQSSSTSPFANINNATTNYAVAQYSTNTSLSGYQFACCPQTKEGAICQEVLSTKQEQCAVPMIPGRCQEVQSCEIGCCIDKQEGLCSSKSTYQACINDGGEWKKGEECLIQECQKGCCLLGDNVEFVTEQRCDVLSLLEGFSQSYFEDLEREWQCLALKETQVYGACVVGEGRCSQESETKCSEIGGDFYEDLLCSHESLNTSCERQSYISCIEGEDEIYWFDSCGNKENIYSSDRETSWANGNKLDKSESCNPLESNAGSTTCGNCNLFLSSTCSETALGARSVKDGDFICKDLTCMDEYGNKRENGESWCVYDSAIGDGKDTAGSRHWKRYCEDGEVKIEPCADYRGQICVQSEIKNDEGDSINTASCVVNEALKCIMEYNQGEEGPSPECTENPDCIVKEIDVDKGFKFDFCTSKYPRGFDLTEDSENEESAKQICALANQECTVIYEKKLGFGVGGSAAQSAATGSDWVCVFNCDCEEEKFAEQMNDLCISLGDCGSYINYKGEGTDNINVENSPDVSWQEYTQYAQPVKGQYAQAKSLEYTGKLLGWNIATEDDFEREVSILAKSVKTVGTISGAGAWIIKGSMFIFPGLFGVGTVSSTVAASAAAEAAATGGFEAAGIAAQDPSMLATTLSGVATVAGSLALGAALGGIIGKIFGLQGDAATALIVTGAIGGLTIGVGVLVSAKFSAFCGPFAWLCFVILIVILLIVAAVLKFLGIGDTKEVIVEFECLPWQAPPGGTNCEACNEDPLKPCTEYRCSSLGQSCELLNENELNPICVNVNSGDRTPPVISPGDIATGFKFNNEQKDSVEVRQFEGGCIKEFTSVLFSLKTDEFAQCKLSYERGKDYEEMSYGFIERTSYSRNHTTSFIMPSISALESEFNITIEGDLREQIGNLNMYVRCQDSNGNLNNKEYAVNFCIVSGPDTTPVEIVKTNPVNGAGKIFNLNEVPLTIFLSEPAQCKFSKEDKSYNEMENGFLCKTGLQESTINGWPCNTLLQGLTQEVNSQDTFYIKCIDQPWFADTDKENLRNINQDSYIYTLKNSQSELSIDSISPSGNIIEGFEPIVVNIEAKTSGGINNGVSQCKYSFTNNNENLISFLNTFSSTHKQKFDLMTAGDYILYVTCEDDAGNKAESKTIFSLKLDTSSPAIVRVFNEGGNLKILTDEKAECTYDFYTCNFNINNASSMTNAFSLEHKAPWNLDNTYHIKCRDIWGNTNLGCGIIVKPSKIY